MFKMFLSIICKERLIIYLSLEAEAPDTLRFSETDEIDECPEKMTLNELSANSFAFIFLYSASISDNSESVIVF